MRASIAERRLLSFCETCRVQPSLRQPATKSAVSKFLSPPTVLPRPTLFLIMPSAVALSRAVSLGQSRIDDERVAVLHHQMPHVAEPGLFAGGFAEQLGIGVGGRGMRIVPALLAMEVALRMRTWHPHHVPLWRRVEWSSY